MEYRCLQVICWRDKKKSIYNVFFTVKKENPEKRICQSCKKVRWLPEIEVLDVFNGGGTPLDPESPKAKNLAKKIRTKMSICPGCKNRTKSSFTKLKEKEVENE